MIISGVPVYDEELRDRIEENFKVIRLCMQITEKEFVKAVKQYTHTSIHSNRGIAQKFYKRLEAIKSFCKSNNIK